MSPAEIVLTTLGVMVLLAVLAPFTRSPERDDATSSSSGSVVVLYALIGVNLAGLTTGVAVAAYAVFG
ncbi:hypothetical protein GCM10009795_017160 [Nocardioides hankookensis]|uniref:Uncharacterized protein n=1 Tax=Nocardioides hankookensis TaxID=443157 RepID=A0ABW1LKD4_9ACTN